METLFRKLTMSVLAGVCCLGGGKVSAEMRYVAIGGGNIAPFTNWFMAATNITDDTLWDTITEGDTLMVSNGIHYMPSRVLLTNSVTITSLYGAAQTILDGNDEGHNCFQSAPLAITCSVYGLTMTNFTGGFNGTVVARTAELHLYDCVLRGNHVNAGGGACLTQSGKLYLNRCVITGNTASVGGGIYIYAGSSLYADHCEFSGNLASHGTYAGAGLYVSGSCVLSNCDIVGNTATGGYGGGVWGGSADITLDNCTVSNNMCADWGAGLSLTAGGNIWNSRITDNYTTISYGGGIYISGGGQVNNCLITRNVSANQGGGAYLNGQSIMRNCTVVSNSAVAQGGVRAGTAEVFLNSIIYHNEASGGGAYSNYYHYGNLAMTNCCVAPDPAAFSRGTGCIASNPMFNVSAPDNFRPLYESPCVNAGINKDWMQGGEDLDGLTRIAEGVVDIGAYEHHPQGTVVMFR